MSFDFLFWPMEEADAWLQGLLAGSPFLVVLSVALLLGLRHACDPDHLVAVTSLVAAEGGDTRGAVRLGAWWGGGHAATLLAIGLPLIAFRAELPRWLEQGAETAVGMVIVLLALRVVRKWLRGDFRAGPHPHGAGAGHRHLYRALDGPEHEHRRIRTPRQAFGIGLLHGLAGTGAVVLLLLAAIPDRLEAAAALAVFAPMSLVSMAFCTTAFSWLLTRRLADPIYRTALIPALGLFGLAFGAWYVGL
jgi:hypothetical protein